MANELTTEEFVRRAKAIHGDKYDYSKVVYQKKDSKVCIICPKHGEFWQTPHNHSRGQKCPKCALENKTMTTEKFISKAQAIHGNMYNYSKVNYIDTKTKVCIICPIHGEFWQRPDIHLRGSICPKCSNNKKAKDCYSSFAFHIKLSYPINFINIFFNILMTHMRIYSFLMSYCNYRHCNCIFKSIYY